MKTRASLLLAGILLTPTVLANDYPTQARVEYVLACMDAGGGQSYDTLYSCVCTIDKIAMKVDYDEFTAAQTLGFLRSTPGERGGVFRDAAPNSRARVKSFMEIEENAQSSCFVKRVNAN
jgi:hypothetical protein